MSKIATIQEKDGEVWTGKVEQPGAGSVAADIAGAILTGGLSSAMSPNHTTVVVNGERHTGQVVNK